MDGTRSAIRFPSSGHIRLESRDPLPPRAKPLDGPFRLEEPSRSTFTKSAYLFNDEVSSTALVSESQDGQRNRFYAESTPTTSYKRNQRFAPATEPFVSGLSAGINTTASAKQEFKEASDKIDALSRKLSIMHRSLLEDDFTSQGEERPTECVGPDRENLIALLEQKIKDINALVVKSVADIRDHSIHEFENINGNLMNHYAQTDDKLVKLEQLQDDKLDMVQARFENQHGSFDVRLTHLENEVSVQNKRIDSLRRDLDKILENHTAMVHSVYLDLKKCREALGKLRPA